MRTESETLLNYIKMKLKRNSSQSSYKKASVELTFKKDLGFQIMDGFHDIGSSSDFSL